MHFTNVIKCTSRFPTTQNVAIYEYVAVSSVLDLKNVYNMIIICINIFSVTCLVSSSGAGNTYGLVIPNFVCNVEIIIILVYSVYCFLVILELQN